MACLRMGICRHALVVYGVRLFHVVPSLCRLGKAHVELRHVPQIVFVQVFDADHPIARLLGCGKQFIEFQVQRDAVLVLALLDQGHHQERDDRGASVDDQLPILRIPELMP